MVLWLSPQIATMPGRTMPCSVATTCSMPCSASPVSNSAIAWRSQLRFRLLACSAAAGLKMTRSLPGCVGMTWLTTATFWPGAATPRPCSCRPAKACGLVYSFIRCRSQYSSTLRASSHFTACEATSLR